MTVQFTAAFGSVEVSYTYGEKITISHVGHFLWAFDLSRDEWLTESQKERLGDVFDEVIDFIMLCDEKLAMMGLITPEFITYRDSGELKYTSVWTQLEAWHRHEQSEAQMSYTPEYSSDE